MNATAELSPRFTCRVVRQWVSVIGNPATADRNSHVAQCADCQAFFAAGDELEMMLRRDASAQRVVPAASLEDQIIHAVRRSNRPARRSYTPLLSFAGVAAAVAFAFIAMRPTTTGPRAVAANPTNPIDAGTEVGADAEQFSALISDMQPKAVEFLRQDPLQDEVDAVVANARTAVGFLAKNFLPANAQPALAGRSG